MWQISNRVKIKGVQKVCFLPVLVQFVFTQHLILFTTCIFSLNLALGLPLKYSKYIKTLTFPLDTLRLLMGVIFQTTSLCGRLLSSRYPMWWKYKIKFFIQCCEKAWKLFFWQYLIHSNTRVTSVVYHRNVYLPKKLKWNSSTTTKIIK